MGDMIFESFLNYFSARFDIESIYFGIYIIYKVEILTAFFIKYQLHLILIFNITCIYYRRFEAEAPDHFCIVYGRISFSVIHASRNENKVRVDVLNSCKVASSQPSYGNIMNNSSSTQCGFFGCFCRHIIHQSVNGHLEATGG